MSRDDPDFSIRDLFNAISDGRHPSWTMYVQTMTFDQAEKVHANPFDLTKIWPHKDFPLQEVSWKAPVLAAKGLLGWKPPVVIGSV